MSSISSWLQRLQLEQRVDEEAVALVGGDAAGRGMRRGHEAQILQIRHDVADRGRGQTQARIARQRARADRLTVADVALDERLQQQLGPLVEAVVMPSVIVRFI